jgi:hypothetical protein
MKRYIYKAEKFTSEYSLRQAIFKHERLAFGKLTPEFMKEYEITEEEYNPEDEWTNDQWADMVRRKRDSLISGTDYFILPDYPNTPDGIEAVKQYRQELRDITLQSGFPRSVQWPSVPSVLSRDKGLATIGLAKVGV